MTGRTPDISVVIPCFNVENNIAIGAYKTEDIKSVIKKYLYDDNVKSKMDLAKVIL